MLDIILSICLGFVIFFWVSDLVYPPYKKIKKDKK
jgi:hypothetical protein